MSGSQQQSGEGNYLSRAGQGDLRQFPRRTCNVFVGIIFPRRGVREISMAELRLVNISEGGTQAVTERSDIPDHFSLFFGSHQYYVGCSVVGRRGQWLHVKFATNLSTEFVDVVARLANPNEFRTTIRPEAYGLA